MNTETSRTKILAALAKNKPAQVSLPALELADEAVGMFDKFSAVAISIGSRVFQVKGYQEIINIIAKEFGAAKRIVSNVEELTTLCEGDEIRPGFDAHSLENVELAILEGQLAVAEDSAIWVPERKMMHRVLPFICQHLALVIQQKDIVPNLYHAYEKIESTSEGYGVFIAGPSKTADIEQSLVLGAHGPRSLWVFVLAA